jgi:hypothetical protein
LWQKCYDFGNTFGEYLSQIEVPAEETFARRNAKLADQHADNALFTALGRGRTPSSGERKTPAGNTVNEDISTLKGEVAQLRELIYELRKHHISEPSTQDSSRTPTSEETLPPSAETLTPLKTPQSQTPPLGRNFTRTSTRISLARSQTSSSSPRKPGKRNRRRETSADQSPVESTAPVADPALFAS